MENKVYFAGFKEVETATGKSICLIFKDKVSKGQLLAAKGATKTGTVFAAKGYTAEDIKAAYPYGKEIPELKWGKQNPKFEKGVYELEEV